MRVGPRGDRASASASIPTSSWSAGSSRRASWLRACRSIPISSLGFGDDQTRRVQPRRALPLRARGNRTGRPTGFGIGINFVSADRPAPRRISGHRSGSQFHPRLDRPEPLGSSSSRSSSSGLGDVPRSRSWRAGTSRCSSPCRTSGSRSLDHDGAAGEHVVPGPGAHEIDSGARRRDSISARRAAANAVRQRGASAPRRSCTVTRTRARRASS